MVKNSHRHHQPSVNLKYPQDINFRKEIGSTLYIVNAHFSDNHQEDMAAKIQSLIERY